MENNLQNEPERYELTEAARYSFELDRRTSSERWVPAWWC